MRTLQAEHRKRVLKYALHSSYARRALAHSLKPLNPLNLEPRGTPHTYRVGSATPASANPFFLSKQLSHRPQANPSGVGS
jgi:hypothetical protein